MRPRPTLLLAIALVSCLALLSPPGAAVQGRGDLDAPHVAMSQDFPEADLAKVHAALRHDGARFLGGHWLNRHTSLRYAGDTIAVNTFTERLAACPGVTVHVTFHRRPSAMPHDWMVTKMAGEDVFVVRINLASEAVDLERLHLPPLSSGR